MHINFFSRTQIHSSIVFCSFSSSSSIYCFYLYFFRLRTTVFVPLFYICLAQSGLSAQRTIVTISPYLTKYIFIITLCIAYTVFVYHWPVSNLQNHSYTKDAPNEVAHFVFSRIRATTEPIFTVIIVIGQSVFISCYLYLDIADQNSCSHHNHVAKSFPNCSNYYSMPRLSMKCLLLQLFVYLHFIYLNQFIQKYTNLAP